MQLLPHQKKVVPKIVSSLNKTGIAYLVGEVRTGKTVTALVAAEEYAGSPAIILFITKKKAIPGIEKDVKAIVPRSNVTVINYEQAINYGSIFTYVKPELIIYDEAHTLGAFPKLGKRARLLWEKFKGIPAILMSGTPHPETPVQLFHQFYVTGRGPWQDFRSFYKWAHVYVNIKQLHIGNVRPINDYKEAKPAVLEEFDKIKIIMTQKEAGFTGKIEEVIINIEAPPKIESLLRELKKDRVIAVGTACYQADTAAKYASLMHQLSSGTVIGKTISDYKAQYVKKKFKGKKIAIFYYFIQEGKMLREVFKKATDSPETFSNERDSVFISQITAAREGINLASADTIIFINISYSAVSYWQARARSLSRKGGCKKVVWLFSDIGIEKQIYNIVSRKKNFTARYFNDSHL